MSKSATVPLLEVRQIQKFFPIKTGLFSRVTGHVHAVDGVSFSIEKGETLALVGESGCGKSTVGRSILRLFDLTSGEVILDGTRIDNLSAGALRPLRKRIAVIFQDPFSSLNPRMRVHDIIAEPIRNFGLETDEAKIKERVAYLLDKVRLSKDAGERWPHEFSGGQRQRICIARALAAEPDLSCFLIPSILTRRPCFQPFLFPILKKRPSVLCCRAMCRAPSNVPRAATSIRAAQR
jgi:peptide/nickel transport system ATP-binding protein